MGPSRGQTIPASCLKFASLNWSSPTQSLHVTQRTPALVPLWQYYWPGLVLSCVVHLLQQASPNTQRNFSSSNFYTSRNLVFLINYRPKIEKSYAAANCKYVIYDAQPWTKFGPPLFKWQTKFLTNATTKLWRIFHEKGFSLPVSVVRTHFCLSLKPDEAARSEKTSLPEAAFLPQSSGSPIVRFKCNACWFREWKPGDKNHIVKE